MLNSPGLTRSRAVALAGSRPVLAAVALALAIGCTAVLEGLPPSTPHIVSSLVLVALALILSYRSTASARPANPAFLFIIVYIGQVYIGTLPIYTVDGTSDPNIIAGGLLAVAFGAYITGSHWHPNRHEDLRPSPRQALSDGAVFWAVGVGSLVVAIYAYLFYRTVGVPLLSDNIAQTFSDINNAPRYTVIVLYNLPIILSLVLLAQASHLRSRFWYVLAGVAGLVFAILIVTTARRWPIFYLAICWLILLGQFGRLLRPRNVFIGLALAGVILASVTYVGLARSPYLSTTVGAHSGLGGEISFIVSQRLFAEQAQVVAVIFHYFPNTYNFLGGFTLKDEFFRLPGTQPQFDFGRFLYGILSPVASRDPSAKVGSAPPTMLGEFYANFGLGFTMALMAAWGAVLGLWERYARPWTSRGALYLVTYSILTMYMASSAIVGLYVTMTNFGYNIALILLFVVLPPVALGARLLGNHSSSAQQHLVGHAQRGDSVG